MLLERENLCFSVAVGDRCWLCCNRLRFETHYFVWLVVYLRVLLLCPVAMLVGVCEYGLDVLFVHQGDVFFGLAECYIGECSEDVEADLCHGVYVVCV